MRSDAGIATPVASTFIVEPKVAIGGGGSSGAPRYVSTGPQEPFSGDSTRLPGHGQLCGGATFYPGLGFWARVGLDVNICTGSKTLGSGDTALFTIQRHGPGDVRLDAATRMLLDALVKAEVPVGPANSIFLSAGVGPSFREVNLTLTSDQTFFGGGVPAISQTTWQTGVGVSAGGDARLSQLRGRQSAQGRRRRPRALLPRGVGRSAFARLRLRRDRKHGRTTEYSGLLTFGVPLTISDARLKRDVVRVGRLDNGIALYSYRYLWSDEVFVGVMAQEVAQRRGCTRLVTPSPAAPMPLLRATS